MEPEKPINLLLAVQTGKIKPGDEVILKEPYEKLMYNSNGYFYDEKGKPQDWSSEHWMNEDYKIVGIPLKDGESCGHKGCLNHITQPCEKCGRIGGQRMTFQWAIEKINGIISETEPQPEMVLNSKLAIAHDEMLKRIYTITNMDLK